MERLTSNFQNQGQKSKNDVQMDAFNKQEEKTERLMMKDSLNNIKQDLQQMVRKQETLANKGCPTLPDVRIKNILILVCRGGSWLHFELL